MAVAQRAVLWERVDTLAARAPGLRDLRVHGLQLVAARAARPVPAELRLEQQLAAVRALCVEDTLRRARAAIDGDVLLMKGPEAAARWEHPATRPYADLDLLVADGPAAQAAMLRAGFRETGDPALYRDIHHLRPLQWDDQPLLVELHHRPKWPARLAPPPAAELFATAVPSATGVVGIGAPDPAVHALLLAGHAWAHRPLAVLRHLVDVVAVGAERDPRAIAALAERWGCARLWRTTLGAAEHVLLDGPPTPATRSWARCLAAARECSVLEHHLQESAAALWALPPAAGGAAIAERCRALVHRPVDESWRAKLRRSAQAVRDARRAQSAHDATVTHPPIRHGTPEETS